MTRNRIKSQAQIAASRLQYFVYFAVAFGVFGLTIISYVIDHSLFQKYFGRLNPLLVVLTIILLGGMSFVILQARGWFTIYQRGSLRALPFSTGWAGLLAFVIVLVDYKVILPKDINVLFPASLLFYPAMGFVVEILFHLLPLALLLLILTSISKHLYYSRVIWPCIVLVSFLEPIFQTIAGYSQPYPIWLMGYVGLHIFLINFVQLSIFKRYDFLSMYVFRLVYYLIWHIVRGYLRLKVLF